LDHDQLFAQSADRLLLYIRLRMGPGLSRRIEPVDALQEVWLAALQGLEGFESRGPGSFLRWLCKIADNRLAGLAEHHGALKRRPAKAMARVSRIVDLARDPRSGPLSGAVRIEARGRLAEAIDQLAEDEREALMLRFFQGLEQAEIAQRLETSTSSVQRLLGRALVKIGGPMREFDDGPLT